jgi:hypothetical protein
MALMASESVENLTRAMFLQLNIRIKEILSTVPNLENKL